MYFKFSNFIELKIKTEETSTQKLDDSDQDFIPFGMECGSLRYATRAASLSCRMPNQPFARQILITLVL
jgi:hypothetical protein